MDQEFKQRLQDFEKVRHTVPRTGTFSLAPCLTLCCHPQQCLARIKQVEAEGTANVHKVEEEMKKKEQEHIKIVVQIRKSMDDQRSKAVRMEITKWQKV